MQIGPCWATQCGPEDWSSYRSSHSSPPPRSLAVPKVSVTGRPHPWTALQTRNPLMGSYAPFEHYLTTLEVQTRPKFWPPTTVFWTTVRGRRQTGSSCDPAICVRVYGRAGIPGWQGGGRAEAGPGTPGGCPLRAQETSEAREHHARFRADPATQPGNATRQQGPIWRGITPRIGPCSPLHRHPSPCRQIGNGRWQFARENGRGLFRKPARESASFCGRFGL